MIFIFQVTLTCFGLTLKHVIAIDFSPLFFGSENIHLTKYE